MVIIKKNIWVIFYIILFVSTLILSSLIYNLYKNEYFEYTRDQENLTNISAASINSVLLQYEMVLDILGNQLLKNDTYTDFNGSRRLLDSILETNPSLAAFALVRKDGQVYVTSSSLKNIKKLPNLIEDERTRDTFLKALNSKVMVTGRTYFFKPLNNLVIPIRKAIRDENGNVLAVMIAGIKVNKSFNLLSNTQNKTIIIRDEDRYLQLINTNKVNDESIYKIQVPLEHLKASIKKAEKKYNKSIEDIKNNELVFTIFYKALIINKEVLASIKYLKRYDLWVISQIDTQIINSSITKKASILIIIFILLIIMFYLLFRNIYEYELKKQEALYYQATHDYLTSLNNRLYLLKEFDKKHTLDEYTLFFIDLDNFKSINDNYGHECGDNVLKEVAHRLTKFKQNNDYLIRNSGDEFLLIKSTVNKKQITQIAQNIIDIISKPYLIANYKFILGASIGIAQYPNDAKDIDEIKRYADIAMYEAKKEKNCFHFFEDSIKQKYLRNSLIEQELKTALENNEIYLVYQPQVKGNGKLFGVEALVRWNNKKLGLVSPEEFIKIAESSGQMTNIGQFIVQSAIKEIKEIQESYNCSFQLSLNISVKQFMDINFYDELLNCIKKNNFNKLSLTLEVTENLFIEDLKYILELLNNLKKEGVKISLDDFGTGYSSLNLLRKLPLDELKIDKSFLDDILDDYTLRKMVQSIISIGKKLNLQIIAEGIEKIEQKELLVEYGCDLFQGYYFSKPLEREKFLKYLEDNRL